MINGQVCLAEAVPSGASISQALNQDFGYSHKRLHKIARESVAPENELKLVEFLAACADKDAQTMHFFDEASVIRTAGNWNIQQSEVKQLKFNDMHQKQHSQWIYYTVLFEYNTLTF